MGGVEEVRQLDDTHLHWVAEIAGVHREWDARITEQIPDERVAWTNIDGATNGGVVTFHRLAPDRTRAQWLVRLRETPAQARLDLAARLAAVWDRAA